MTVCSRKHLAKLLGLPIQTIRHLLEDPQAHYRRFFVGEGDRREIQAALDPLKEVHKRLHARVLSNIPLPNCILGGVRGRSILENARIHVGCDSLYVLDIENFFPSVTEDMLERALRRADFNRQPARDVARLCTVDGRLPLGTHTSMALGNIVMRDAIGQISDRAAQLDVRVTLWVDDLILSGPICTAFLDFVHARIARLGLRPNRDKTGWRKKGRDPMIVTGVNIEHGLAVPNDHRKLVTSLARELVAIRGNEEDNPILFERVLGKLAFYNYISPDQASLVGGEVLRILLPVIQPWETRSLNRVLALPAKSDAPIWPAAERL